MIDKLYWTNWGNHSINETEELVVQDGWLIQSDRSEKIRLNTIDK